MGIPRDQHYLEFPGPMDSENVLAGKNNFRPGALEAKMCPKFTKNFLAKIFEIFAYEKM